MIRKILAILLCVTMLFCFAACEQNTGDKKSDDVLVLFTNDVHCGIDENIGYAGLSAYKKEMSEKYKYVVLADCGDFTQGAYIGTVSKGEYLVDITNAVGYDFSILGNHEFDYGTEQAKKNIQLSNSQFLNCNISYNGSGENWIGDLTKPYEIVKYGKIKVAFIGITTPKMIENSSPLKFMENGEIVYDFAKDENGQKFFNVVQKNVDECRKKGADYVVILSHLGMDIDVDTPYTSLDLANNTTGIDVILDAHSHTEASCWIRQNKDGEDVLLSSTGTKLSNIGKLILGADGTISVGYVDDYQVKDPAITKKIESINSEFEEQMNSIVGKIDFKLSCYDDSGVRMVRSREIPIGDFVADAYRVIGNADIGLCNGGGIRADLNAGDITYSDIISVSPYGNSLCVVKVTGSEILDMLEYFYRFTQSEYKKGETAVGEDGSFQQVSGLKFKVNTAVKSSVQTDETDALIGIGATRRISDVMVLKDGAYLPIDPEATYTIASHNYMIKNGGSGMLLYLKDHELVVDEAVSDYQVLIDYINMLGNDISKYQNVDNRITIK